MFHWKLKSDGVILPEERLPAGQTVVFGVQHVVAMFGATVLAPILTGFDPNVAVLFSGIGTLIFFVLVGGRVPSYLGSSFSFIAVVIAATGYAHQGANSNIAAALGGIVAAGALYAIIGIGVVLVGYAWVERLMPPVVTGAVVAVIGLNLAPIAAKNVSGTPVEIGIAVVTVVLIGSVATLASGLWQRVPILIGGAAAYLIYCILANGFGIGMPVDFERLAAAPWLGIPNFSAPVFDVNAMALIAPVAVVLVAENLGHLKALSAMIGRNFDGYIGRAFIGDAIATMIAGSGGGLGVTTYAENIGVMGVTKIYSTLVFVIAAIFAIIIGFSPKFGALIATIPRPVVGGLSFILFGLIAAIAGRIWVENNVDFSKPGNLLTVGVTLIAGAGDLTIPIGGFSVGGIGTASLAAVILHQLFALRSDAELGKGGSGGSWSTHSEFARTTSHFAVERAAASIAHEIKQPLSVVATRASAAARWLEKNPPGLVEARNSLSGIIEATGRADAVIQGIRAMFKPDVPAQVALDVNALLAGVLKLLDEDLQKHRIAVHTELGASLPLVLADRVQLQQVVINLITNAIESMVSTTGRPRVLRIKSEAYETGQILVSVKDSGSGIDPESSERMFDAFYSTKSRGMGMGLSICRSIIEVHGGRLWASAGDPSGAVFRFTLPAMKIGGLDLTQRGEALQ